MHTWKVELFELCERLDKCNILFYPILYIYIVWMVNLDYMFSILKENKVLRAELRNLKNNKNIEYSNVVHRFEVSDKQLHNYINAMELSRKFKGDGSYLLELHGKDNFLKIKTN
jgi:hypothetical protein